MTGALTQLIAVGTQNYFLNGKPKKTFFKEELQTHTHFAMESKSVRFHREDVNISTPTILTCTIPRHGDLISDMYLCLELPPLYYDTSHNVRAKWVREVGHQLIDNISVTINGNTIERTYGEWMSMYGSLTTPLGKQHLYNKMIGNTVDMHDPDIITNEINVSKPFVKGRKLVVPLMFWFSREPGCALPLVSLQYDFVMVTVELRPVMHWYLVNVRGTGYTRPVTADPEHALVNFVKDKASSATLEIEPYLEINYIFVDDKERNIFINESLDYLVQQMMRLEKTNLYGTSTVSLVLQNPVKELVLFARDTRTQLTNDYLNATNVDDGTDVITSIKILFNGFERLGEKPIEYFKYIQNYRHHSSSPKDGIYVYSFSLSPEEFQPSGECNMSKINNVQLQLKITPGVVCDLVVYAINYNFLRITSGIAGVAFAV